MPYCPTTGRQRSVQSEFEPSANFSNVAVSVACLVRHMHRYIRFRCVQSCRHSKCPCSRIIDICRRIYVYQGTNEYRIPTSIRVSARTDAGIFSCVLVSAGLLCVSYVLPADGGYKLASWLFLGTLSEGLFISWSFLVHLVPTPPCSSLLLLHLLSLLSLLSPPNRRPGVNVS